MIRGVACAALALLTAVAVGVGFRAAGTPAAPTAPPTTPPSRLAAIAEDHRAPLRVGGRDPRIAGHASWIRQSSMDKILGVTDAVVVGRVVAVDAGKSLTPSRVKPAPPDLRDTPQRRTPEIPTRRIQLDVRDTFRGSVPARLAVFQTGGETKGGDVLSLEGDPVFRVGEEYLLFLKQRDDGLYAYHGPDGRYRVSDDRLKSFDRKSLAGQLDGKSIADVAALVR